jgi:histidinol phosphatase-like enzyme (inositol monophosphatase family)
MHAVPSSGDDRLHSRVELMRTLADRAGTLAMRHFQSMSLAVHAKPDASPVTEADLEIEALLREQIAADFPDDGLLGEEHGAQEGTSSFRWVIDPIDGTISFAAGVPLFGTLIGLERTRGAAREIVAGICAMPALGESVWAARGQGAWWERRGADGAIHRTAARVRASVPLAEALVCTTGLEYFERAGRTDALVAIARAAQRVRGWSDCYGGMLVATGRADAWFDPVMNPWDSGPFPVILEEAGGVFTDWHGRADIHGGSAVAAAPALHAELVRVIQTSASHSGPNANS